MLKSQSKPAPEPIRLPLSRSNSRVKVKAGDKWLLIGTTGSGKTTAAKMLQASLARLYPTARHYILDSKYDGDFDSYPGRVQGDLCPPRPLRNERFQVWQPIKLIPEEIEKWLWNVRRDAPAILHIDELYSLVYKRNVYSDEYNIIQKVGRSLPVGTITSTQELTKIPSNAYKQATHRLGFYLDDAAQYDKRLRNALLKSQVDDPPDPYGFYYQHISSRNVPAYFKSVQEFLGT